MFNNQHQQPMPPFAAMTDDLWPTRLGPLFPNPDTFFVTNTDDSSAAADDLARHPARAAGATRRDIAAKLAALLAFALVGCATPVLKPSVDVPDRFAATQAVDQEPETAWWDSYGDPVLSTLIRRAAAENRDVKIAAERVRAARAGETISRSWLFPSIGVHGAGFDHRTGYDSAIKQTVPEAANTKGWQGGVDVSWEIDI